ncbi:radical SAM/SPASM domain-containing protein [Clostridium kluyveri]|uniref:Radical SAM protein n=1 Tax=Clostridium kluyveri TaxID=1534 RepID=A0A1L5F7Q8_CLOKL|nr:SPASM domain-containing protein [Clostridium kluyveri]APM39066.1 radical SAM protein [Clostridium kluyveri]
MILKKFDKNYNFISIFNTENGFYMRTGILNDRGKDTGVEAFQSSFPELIDIGIMGHCIHGKSGLCLKAGVQCYQDGMNIQDENMSLENYITIINEIKGKTFQVALGGRGDPNKHENFGEILKYTRINNIVPNYTTSGFLLNETEVELTKKYCGAVAVSWYFHEYTTKAIDMFIHSGMKVNIHYVLNNKSIEEALYMLHNNSFPKGINAVIFLLHKPVGLGKEDKVLKCEDIPVKNFFSNIMSKKHSFKIGFDSCSVPALINFNNNFNIHSIDTCEAARWSMYITPDMKALPCSFDQKLKWSVELKNKSISDAWNSDIFESFRNKLKKSCPNCREKVNCMGGCPLCRSIILCNREEMYKL